MHGSPGVLWYVPFVCAATAQTPPRGMARRQAFFQNRAWRRRENRDVAEHVREFQPRLQSSRLRRVAGLRRCRPAGSMQRIDGPVGRYPSKEIVRWCWRAEGSSRRT